MTLYLYKILAALLDAQIRLLEGLIWCDKKILEIRTKQVEELNR